ncbi:hypothetical protein HJFPF1_01604 [Paramyrothecium foliicola]|nr:hypothetical protein HJFPF1_01604 [Paramyrothecium foliicola]
MLARTTLHLDETGKANAYLILPFSGTSRSHLAKIRAPYTLRRTVKVSMRPTAYDPNRKKHYSDRITLPTCSAVPFGIFLRSTKVTNAGDQDYASIPGLVVASEAPRTFSKYMELHRNQTQKYCYYHPKVLGVSRVNLNPQGISRFK